MGIVNVSAGTGGTVLVLLCVSVYLVVKWKSILSYMSDNGSNMAITECLFSFN